MNKKNDIQDSFDEEDVDKVDDGGGEESWDVEEDEEEDEEE